MKMLVNIPAKQNIITPLLKEKAENINFVLPTWIVDVPDAPEDNICWSLLLAYLFPYRKKKEEFQKRCDNLIRLGIENKCFKALQWYNPFRNRYGCFHDNNLISITTKLREALETCATSNSVIKTHGQLSHEDIFEAASQVLKCEIVVVMLNRKKVYIHFYPQKAVNDENRYQSSFADNLVLFGEKKRKRQAHFSFGMSENDAGSLQKEAFEYILYSTELFSKKEIGSIYTMSEVKENFIISLLKGKKVRFLDKLYKHPSYTLHRLTEAGFITDPQVKDSQGNSAFVYAAQSQNAELLRLLYRYSSNESQWKDTPRNPSKQTIKCLKKLNITLKDAIKILSENLKQDLTILHEQLRFNKYQIQVSKNFLKLSSKKINPLNKISVAENKKDTIMEILITYKNFFSSLIIFKKSFNFHNLSTYKKYNAYFYTLDYYSCLLFFDHFYTLKEKLHLENNLYENMECDFLHFIFVNICRFEWQPNLSSRLLEFCHMNRILFKGQIQEFIKELESVVVTSDNAVYSELKDTYTLQQFPVLRDELILMKLRRYMDPVQNLDLSNNRETGVLAIKRTIQVLGESLKANISGCFTVGRSFLITCLPTKLADTLIKVRDEISHNDIDKLEFKLEMEEDMEAFVRIQNELKEISQSLSHVYEIQKLRMRKYVLEDQLLLIKKHCDKFFKNDLSQALDTVFELRIKDINQTLISKPLVDIYGRHFFNIYNGMEEYIVNKLRQSEIAHSVEWFNRQIAIMKSLLSFMIELHAPLPTFEYKFSEICKELEEPKPAAVSKKEKEKNVIYIEAYAKRMRQKIKDVQEFQCEFFKHFDYEIKFLPTEATTSCEAVACLLPNKCIRSEKLSEKEKRIVKEAVPDNIKIKSNARKTLLLTKEEYEHSEIEVLKNEISENKCKLLTEEDVRIKIKNMGINNPETVNSITKSYFEDNYDTFSKWKCGKNSYGNLEKCLDNSSLCESDFSRFCKNFSFNETVQSILEKIVIRRVENEEKLRLKFLLDRISKMKKILISSNDNLNKFWKRAKGGNTKEYFRSILVQYHYIRQPELQAAVEMLYFDYLALFKSVDESDNDSWQHLKYIWSKMERLFNGINLRNVMAHGDLLLQATEVSLDPFDFPMTIISKVLNLISHEEAISALYKLQIKTNADSITLTQMIKTGNCPADCNHLVEEIKKCPLYKDYLYLLKSAEKET